MKCLILIKRLKSKSINNIIKIIGKNMKINNYFIKLADRGIKFLILLNSCIIKIIIIVST